MGKASRSRQRRAAVSTPAVVTQESADGRWSAAVMGRRAADLLAAITTTHPALLSVLVTAAHQYVGEQQRDAAEGSTSARQALDQIGVGTGLSAEQWLTELQALGHDMSQPRHREVPVEVHHRVLIERMHRLLANGQPYPDHAEPYVITPDLHDIVMAASHTVTPEDLFTLEPDTDLPTPAGLLLLPAPTGADPTGHYAPISAISWRPHQARVLPHTPTRHGVFVEGWSLRTDLDRTAYWPLAVQAARLAHTTSPLALPMSSDEFWPHTVLSDAEYTALLGASLLARQLRHATVAGDTDYYDPNVDNDFRISAYIFAFWRLCNQKIARIDTHPSPPPAGAQRRRNDARQARALDAIRLVSYRHADEHLDDSSAAGGGTTSTRAYQHRWPVRMHRVRQWYPLSGTHKIIWRGPYIKGPAGAPLLIGPKSQIVDNRSDLGLQT